MPLFGLSSPGPFFGNKVRAFWNLQIAGWIAWLGLRGVSGLAGGQSFDFLLPVLVSAITGFSLSLLLSVCYRALINRRPILMWGASFGLLATATAIWAFIDAWFLQILKPDSESGFTGLLLALVYVDATSLGAWSALYYAINYFLQLEEQNDRMLRLEAQAASAQLAMLRYQLNPHFLFNTLNSISTLVLLKQSEPANAMLSRLSAFLRYTLANEPTARVTLAQEIETLKLYLDIEKMRFEDRLRPHFAIDPAVSRARLPSLLLQPLIENAIKYAVTPQEEGADITISAQLAGEKVRIVVTDTGTGLPAGSPDPTTGHATESTGVGLANIRDRLAQAFGDQQRFEAQAGANGGFTVTIEFPFQPDGQARIGTGQT
ncbi:sensor histidine kinase [Sphingopyxis indica]|uniref:Histidine kinase-, DNA gyrase B-, and HSP90-like ATPase n=1 Tax=Sphingopyxis indica TaxID=436663 RepID=A0A239I5X2_9SPHN|nr:histidine kinase [Sphingopyxis indica]WOF45601.1 histidine kinase [Sphingopyxis indica]SNS88698.1 Histidine kinase-, DNA gyrase B-, and HSP90-like ATPase [Sphingopyxis indica]